MHQKRIWGRLAFACGQQEKAVDLLERAKAGFVAIGLHNWAEVAEESLAQSRCDANGCSQSSQHGKMTG